MKFLYEYRTSDNAKHDGEIFAANREAAYADLKKKGIKPSRFVEAPGIFNKLFGKGKRWLAIAVLSVVAVVAMISALGTKREIRRMTALSSLPRHQIEGLPSNWADSIECVFSDDLDRLLARYSQPGVRVVSVQGTFDPGNEEWVLVLQRIVAGMREEAAGFLSLGKTLDDLAQRLEERQQMESDYREQIVRKFVSGSISEDEANSILAAVGLEKVGQKNFNFPH